MSPEALAGVDTCSRSATRPAEVDRRLLRRRRRSSAPPLPDRRARQAARCCSGPRRPAPPRLDQRRPAAPEHQRHTRKYAEGELGEDKSFYFRGPDDALNLRAQNLMMFLQIADGVDDATWLHHLRARRLLALVPRGDQGRELADEAERLERGDDRRSGRQPGEHPRGGERRYTAPAKAGAGG